MLVRGFNLDLVRACFTIQPSVGGGMFAEAGAGFE